MTQAPPRQMPGPEDIKRYRSNLKEEVDGAALYRYLAGAERDPHLKELFERLALSEDRHGALWQRKLVEAGAEVPSFQPSLRVRLLGWLARRFGTQAVAPIVTRMEASATTMYDAQPEAVAENLPADERAHALLFRELTRTNSPDAGVNIARAERRHGGATGNMLRASVLGINDGLVSSLSLVMGVAGADPGRSVVAVTGVAGLLAGSLAMALGEWISVRSSVEMFERQVSIERDELSENPEEEEEELILIYQAKGLNVEDARTTARRIISNPTTALDTLVREELGMSHAEAGNPWVAGGSSFMMFSLGAILPVVPWFFAGGGMGVALSAVLAGIGLFASGAVTTLFTGRNVLFSGTRMLLFGLTASAITFAVGKAVGVSTGV